MVRTVGGGEGARFSEVDETRNVWTRHRPGCLKRFHHSVFPALVVQPAHVAQTVCHVTQRAFHVQFRANYDPCLNPEREVE